MFGRIFVPCAALALAAFACTVNSSDPVGTPAPGTPGAKGTGGASAEQVSSCKESCNKMKFFGCNSAEQQAACYDDCGKAAAAQIELFTACAGTSICDPACRTNITPKPPSGTPPATGTGATSSSCGTACAKLVSCSFVKLAEESQCKSVCEKEAYQYQIDCINNNACDKLQSACGGGSSGGETSSGGPGDDTASIRQCESTCDQLLFLDCIEASDQSSCRAQCAATTSAKRAAFSSCVPASAGQCTKGNACYAALKN